MILFSSYLFYFCFLFLGTVKTQCLTQISSSTTSCLFCSHNYYDSKASEHFLQTSPQINAHDCIIKSNSSSERNVLVTNGISFDATSVNTYDQIYGDLFEAFYNESIIASSYFNASITFLLSKGQHFISKNSLNKSNEFIFRRVNANILIKPVFCSEFNILNLCTNEKNIIIKIKSLNFSFIISKKLEIQNIDFDAVDSYYNNNTENNTCINQNISCCEENSLRDPTNSCYINFSRHSYLSQNNENEKNYYGFFSLEAIFDDPDYSIPEIALKNVSFIDFYIFESLETSFMSVIIIDYFGGSLMIKNLLISNSFFRYPIIIYNSTISLKKDYYKFDKFGQFLNNYNQTLKSFQKINIENLEIINYNIFGYEYNIINDFTTGIILLNNYGSNEISLKNIFFSNITTIQNNYLFYFENITGNLSNFILKNITNLTLFHFKNSKISIDDFIILESTWVNYAIYCFDTSTLLLLQFQFLNSSVFKITVPNIFFFGSNSQVVFDNNSFNNLVCLSFDFRNSLVYFSNSTFSNLIMKNSEFYFLDTHLALFDSKWVNITGFTYLFYFVSCSQLEITNNIITELSGSYFISGTSLTTVLIKSSTFSNLKNFNYLLNKYTVFENIFIENSKFKQISLSTALIYSVTELNLSISHSQFSNVSLISSKSTNFICVQVGQELIQNSSFTNIIFLAGGTAVINFKVSMVLVKDSIFENCGFAYPINILDFKSIEYVNMMYIWTCIEIVIHNNSFINKGAVNLFSGFIHCTLALVKVSVIGNIFQYKDKIADVYYTGLIFSNAPIIIFNNNKFHNLQCPEFPSFIHNNGAVTLQGDSTYNPMKNKKIASLNNNSFFGCTCKKGGSLGIINYDYVYVTNLYIYNSSSSLGGSILLTCSTFAQFKNILINSTYGNQAHTINLKYIGYLYFGNFVINNGFSQSNGGIKVRDVDSLLINLMNVFNSSTLDSGGVFNIKIGNTQIINSLFVRCFASLTGGMVYLTGTGNLSLMNVTVENSSSKMGGAIYLEDSNQLFISQSIFNQTFSIEQGGALYVNLIQNLSLISTYFTFCESWTNGIIYFKNSENEANYNINGLVCLENVANSGSCIFSETRGNLTLNNFQISENLNNSIYFISSFNMFVDLTNGSVRNCFSNAHILYGNNIFLTVSQVIFENNSILLSVFFLEGLKISKLEKIVFNNNERLKNSQPTPLINSLTSDVNISEMQFNQSLNSIFWTFVLSAEESNIILSNIIISDQTHDDQSLILSDSGTFQLSFASFIRCQGPILKIIHANILIDQSIFIDNLQGTYSFIADITIAGFFEQNMIVWISNSTFHPKNSLSTSITDVAKFIFDGCNFNGDYTGQGLRIISASNIVISNSLFSNLINVKDGGAVEGRYGHLSLPVDRTPK